MAVMGKDVFDLYRPHTHTKIQFGDKGYWVEWVSDCLPYGAILTEILNYNIADYNAKLSAVEQAVAAQDPGLLSERLEANLMQAKATRIDAALSVEVRNPVREYLGMLGSMPRKAKSTSGDTVYYQTKKRARFWPFTTRGRRFYTASLPESWSNMMWRSSTPLERRF